MAEETVITHETVCPLRFHCHFISMVECPGIHIHTIIINAYLYRLTWMHVYLPKTNASETKSYILYTLKNYSINISRWSRKKKHDVIQELTHYFKHCLQSYALPRCVESLSNTLNGDTYFWVDDLCFGSIIRPS